MQGFLCRRYFDVVTVQKQANLLEGQILTILIFYFHSHHVRQNNSQHVNVIPALLYFVCNYSKKGVGIFPFHFLGFCQHVQMLFIVQDSTGEQIVDVICLICDKLFAIIFKKSLLFFVIHVNAQPIQRLMIRFLYFLFRFQP